MCGIEAGSALSGRGTAGANEAQGIGLAASALGWVLAAPWAAAQTTNGYQLHCFSLQSNSNEAGPQTGKAT